MAAGTKAQTYKAVFERTQKKNVEGRSQVVTLIIDDPEDPRLQALVDDGKRGYVRVTEASTGKRIHGMQLSALAARDIMKGCAAGTYNPFPPIRNKKKEVQ